MTPERARLILKEVYEAYPPDAPYQARNLLKRYNNGEAIFGQVTQEKELQYYMALQILSTADMGADHAADPKRSDRRNGQKLRKKRTGSRKG